MTWDGRWKLENAVIGPVPHRKGGPPIWMGGITPGAMQRGARYFDGWFPIWPSPGRLSSASSGERFSR